MDLIGAENIFKLYRVFPQASGEVKRQLAGRFLVHNDHLFVLEDYFGALAHLPEGPVSEKTNHWLTRMKQNPYWDIVTDQEVRAGQRQDLIPEEDLGDPAEETQAQLAGIPATPGTLGKPSRPAKFEYYRDGQVHNIEFRHGSAFLDGQQLDVAEVQRILQHHQTGIGVIRYPSERTESPVREEVKE